MKLNKSSESKKIKNCLKGKKMLIWSKSALPFYLYAIISGGIAVQIKQTETFIKKKGARWRVQEVQEIIGGDGGTMKLENGKIKWRKNFMRIIPRRRIHLSKYQWWAAADDEADRIYMKSRGSRFKYKKGGRRISSRPNDRRGRPRDASLRNKRSIFLSTVPNVES